MKWQLTGLDTGSLSSVIATNGIPCTLYKLRWARTSNRFASAKFPLAVRRIPALAISFFRRVSFHAAVTERILP